MAPNDIKEKLTRKLFQPLRVYISDGSSYDIESEGIAAVNRMEMFIGIDPDASGLSRRSIYIDPRHVTRIEPLTNGPDISPRSNRDRR